MTPIQAVNSPQISLLRKEALEELGASVIFLMMELTQYVACAWDGSTVAPLSKSLIDTHWGLRFDELIYVFRKIKNGEYGKEFGVLQYAELSRRISDYFGNERSEAESHLRNINAPKEKEIAVDPEMKKITDELFSQLAKQWELKAKVEKNNGGNRPAITDKSIDRRNYEFVYQLNYNENLSDDDLLKFHKDAIEFGWEETKLFCKQEIEKRK